MTVVGFVTRIAVRPHPNADRLSIGEANGVQVIVSSKTKSGDLGVFFPADTQLSLEYCKENKLIAEYDENGKKIGGGYFSDNRRVRAQKFRGERSDGLWMPENSFSYMPKEFLNVYMREGTKWETTDGYFSWTSKDNVKHDIVKKYFTDSTVEARSNRDKVTAQRVKLQRQFPQYPETEPLKFSAREIPKGSALWISEKYHGTSFRYGNVWTTETIKLNPLKRFINFIARKEIFAKTKSYYKHTIGTRRTVLSDTTNPRDFYGEDAFRRKAVEGIELQPGEVMYGELLGYVSDSKLIMPKHPIKDELKHLRKIYGKDMVYTYGTEPGQCRMIVYHMVKITPEGKKIDYNWTDVRSRCRELGIEPAYYTPFTFDYNGDDKELLSALSEMVDGRSGQDATPSHLDSRHISEGIVLKVIQPNGEVKHYKFKSWVFGVLEGYIKDVPNYVDEEESN